MILEIVAREISLDDLFDLTILEDSGQRIAAEQLTPLIGYKSTEDTVTVINALATFKHRVENIEVFREPPKPAQTGRDTGAGWGPNGNIP
jgi:hypothetical protein